VVSFKDFATIKEAQMEARRPGEWDHKKAEEEALSAERLANAMKKKMETSGLPGDDSHAM
jgi:hypothetical protein